MKAIVYTQYGSPDVLQLKEVPKPTPKGNEVLVRVHAASVNSWDWDLLRGTPFIVRVWGLTRPKNQIPGADIAGHVESVGSNVEQFAPGDEVFGDLSASGWGGYAEYVCAPETALALKSTDMTFEQSAAIPQAAVMALQGIRDNGNVQLGQKVLINGAGGGVGTFAVQLAKAFGAEVTGVDSTGKLEVVSSIGADHVIDYTQDDFAKYEQRYDLILDTATYRSIFDFKRALCPSGAYFSVGGASSRVFPLMVLGPLVSMTGSQKMGIVALKQNKNLEFLNELFEAGKLVPTIDSRYLLGDTPEALRHFGSGDFTGKVVITLQPGEETGEMPDHSPGRRT